MPTQEVPSAAELTPLLASRPSGRRSIVLDGRGPDSWGSGWALRSDCPRATLSVYPAGWARWSIGQKVFWRHGEPLAQWEEFLTASAASVADRDAAGFLTVLGYDLKHWIERLPRRHGWTGSPVLYSALYDWCFRYDYGSGRGWVQAQSADTLHEKLAALQASHTAPDAPPRANGVPHPRPLLTRDEYLSKLAIIQNYIAAGDVYQVNLAQPFVLPIAPQQSAIVFAALQQQYPMPFAAYVDAGEFVIVSNSPECLLTVDGGAVATFPIKGTRALTNGAGPEHANVRALADDPKERAEHVMIVDLERNDLGRVCQPGSVEVSALGAVRTYPFLAHMVSQVRGQLQRRVSLPALIRAVFPGGSITGAPKIRAMQIIEELEPCARGFYTGAIGWTDLHGRSWFNLAIRTAVLTGAGLTYWAGGGVVADSQPEREYEETWLKSRAFFRAVETALPQR